MLSTWKPCEGYSLNLKSKNFSRFPVEVAFGRFHPLLEMAFAFLLPMSFQDGKTISPSRVTPSILSHLAFLTLRLVCMLDVV